MVEASLLLELNFYEFHFSSLSIYHSIGPRRHNSKSLFLFIWDSLPLLVLCFVRLEYLLCLYPAIILGFYYFFYSFLRIFFAALGVICIFFYDNLQINDSHLHIVILDGSTIRYILILRQLLSQFDYIIHQPPPLNVW